MPMVVQRGDGPRYVCRRAPKGGWRCGRCDQGVIVHRRLGAMCPVCQAEVVHVSGWVPGLMWLVILVVVGLLLGWVVLGLWR